MFGETTCKVEVGRNSTQYKCYTAESTFGSKYKENQLYTNMLEHDENIDQCANILQVKT